MYFVFYFYCINSKKMKDKFNLHEEIKKKKLN
jgi:hypothetical protein